jgi:hypothetical protein
MVHRLLCFVAGACFVLYYFELMEVSFKLPCPVNITVKFGVRLMLSWNLFSVLWKKDLVVAPI